MFKEVKYPGLGPLAKANGIKYITALQRVTRYGWSIQAATTIPVGQPNPDIIKKKSGPKGPRKPKPRPMSLETFGRLHAEMIAPVPVPGFVAKPYTPPVDRKRPWERPGYVKALRPKKVRSRHKPTGRHRGREVEDTSPPRIQALRAAYCAEFIKTGFLNPEMATKLKEYANEVHRAARLAARISAEQKVENLRRGQAPLRDEHRRDGEQPDGHA